MNGKVTVLLVAILAAALALVGSGQRAQAEERTEEAAERAEERAERAEERAERRAGKTERRAGGAEDDGGGSGEVTLEIGGDPGTEFSGACIVGDEEYDIDGQVPQSYTYDELDGQGIECGIRRQGDGELKVVFEAGNARSVQRTNASAINLSYDGNGGISFSTTSGSSSSQVTSISSSSSSSSRVISRMKIS